jgi:putative transposase
LVKKKASLIPLDIRKEMINKDDKAKSICNQCELLGLARSTLYYTPMKTNDRDLRLMEELDRLYLEDPTRGTRRMTKELKKMGYRVGRTHVRTLMQIMRLKTVYCRPRTTVIDPAKYKFPYLLRNLDIIRPNHVWCLDITYIPMRRGFMYLLAIMDIFSRYIVGWSLSNTMEAEWVVKTLKEAINKHGKPDIINSDQGSQFTSEEYVAFVKTLETVRISMDGKGRALDNVYIERFFRTIKYEKIYLEHPETGYELHQICSQFMNYYNEKRDHSSIGDIAPIKRYRNAA